MKYGYVEMRARLPKGKGLWPAFWLLHDANNKNRPEIDVMEMLEKAKGMKANLLLNTGPLPDGSIHPDDVKTLNEVGRRLQG